MISHIGPVTAVQDTGATGADAYRGPLVPGVDINALNVQAATLKLLPALGTTVAEGSYLNAATQHEPVAVPGA